MALSSFPPSLANRRAPGAGVTAVLGPTNTGKTHLAIERMLAHSSGLIGLPASGRHASYPITFSVSRSAAPLNVFRKKFLSPHAQPHSYCNTFPNVHERLVTNAVRASR